MLGIKNHESTVTAIGEAPERRCIKGAEEVQGRTGEELQAEATGSPREPGRDTGPGGYLRKGTLQ